MKVQKLFGIISSGILLFTACATGNVVGTSSIPTPTNTIQSPTETPTTTPELKITIGSEQISANIVQSSISDYVHAFNLSQSDKQITNDQLMSQLIEGKLKDGTKVIITSDKEPIPLLIQIKDGTWQEATLKDFSPSVGISVDGSENYTSALYVNTVTQNFNLIMPDGTFAVNTLQKYGDNMAVEFANLAASNNMRFRILSAFHYSDVPYSGDLSTKDKVDAFIKARLEQLLDPKFIKPGSKTEFVVVHESTVQDWGDGSEHWLGEGADKGLIRLPYFDAYGKDWPIKAYQLAFEIAKEKGLVVGQDVVFAFSDYDFLQNSNKEAMVERLIDKIRNGVAADPLLGLKPEDVKINIIDQTHMHADPGNARGWQGIYTKNIDPVVIAQNVAKLSKFGDVEMSEIDVSGTNDLQTKGQAIESIVSACYDAGCTSVDFYQALRFDSTKPENFSLFNTDYSRSIIYYMVLQALLKNNLQTNQ